LFDTYVEKLSVDKSTKKFVALATNVQLSVKPVAVMADVVNPVGVGGMVNTVCVFELDEDPAAFTALSLMEYVVPAVSPVMLIVVTLPVSWF